MVLHWCSTAYGILNKIPNSNRAWTVINIKMGAGTVEQLDKKASSSNNSNISGIFAQAVVQLVIMACLIVSAESNRELQLLPLKVQSI